MLELVGENTPPAKALVFIVAANLGDDADTTAAITGQLAGALHGASGIADRWLERLHLAPEITALADALWQAARGARDASPTAPVST